MVDWSVQLSPSTDGCGWVQLDPYSPPRCPEEAVYELVSPLFPEDSGIACVEHTARLRELHPEWIASIRLLPAGESNG